MDGARRAARSYVLATLRALHLAPLLVAVQERPLFRERPDVDRAIGPLARALLFTFIGFRTEPLDGGAIDYVLIPRTDSDDIESVV